MIWRHFDVAGSQRVQPDVALQMHCRARTDLVRFDPAQRHRIAAWWLPAQTREQLNEARREQLFFELFARFQRFSERILERPPPPP
jgi:hypothetical protein